MNTTCYRSSYHALDQQTNSKKKHSVGRLNKVNRRIFQFIQIHRFIKLLYTFCIGRIAKTPPNQSSECC